jgi:Arc/MetJ family transcription regulator
MRTTLTLDDDLLERARDLTGIAETSALVRTALAELVRREAGRRLAALGGSEPFLDIVRRRRPGDPAE